ncbi:MAG: ethanolamine ammonia-lyase reactivating factor EutA, partial [Chloroflexi bacterium]|nr:ethanolamine ammonia-lyase reactivating factor EutA [Chloroflexota bacterium]
MTESPQAHAHSGAFSGMHSHDGGPLHWHDEFGEHYSEDLTADERLARELDWKKHHLVLVTVGADIGSSTSHLMFSRIFMQLVGEAPRVHSVIVAREILWQSPILLTPYAQDGSIDADTLRTFVGGGYAEVGAQVTDVDTGAIVLTGEALKRHNARAVAELFAMETGKFVCASAGHHLEAVLAANGSGTVMRSRRDGTTLLNVDIGGGTTKLALVADGEIVGTAALAVGARQLVKDADGRLVRIDDPVKAMAAHLGIQLALGEPLAADAERTIVQTWADCIAGRIMQRPMDSLTQQLMLTDPLPEDVAPQAITFSGGVSEYIFFRETADFGDLGQPLARAIRGAL